jgi:hypothetical protein
MTSITTPATTLGCFAPDPCPSFFSDANSNGVIDADDLKPLIGVELCSPADTAQKIIAAGRHADGTHAHYYMLGEYHVVPPVAQACALIDAIAVESGGRFAHTMEWTKSEAQPTFDRYNASAKTVSDRQQMRRDMLDIGSAKLLKPEALDRLNAIDWDKVRAGDTSEVDAFVDDESNYDISQYKELSSYEELLDSAKDAVRHIVPRVAVLDRAATKGGNLFAIDCDDEDADQETRESAMTADMRAVGEKYAYVMGINGAAHTREHLDQQSEKQKQEQRNDPQMPSNPMAARLSTVEGSDAVLSIQCLVYTALEGYQMATGVDEGAHVADLYWLQKPF